jgi:hypothetical protein
VLAPFPLGAIRSSLQSELIETVKAEALIKGISLPAVPTQIAKIPFHIDSLVVVAILCAVEPIVGFELPESVVRSGGYDSAESALAQLLPRIEKEWFKMKGTAP